MEHYSDDVDSDLASRRTPSQRSGWQWFEANQPCARTSQRVSPSIRDLKFDLLDTLWGLRSLVLYYRNQNGARTAEFMEIGENGKVTQVIANYAGL